MVQNLKRIFRRQGVVVSWALLATLALMNAWVIHPSRRGQQPSSFSALSQLSPDWVRWVSAGYSHAAVSLLWISTLSQIGTGVYDTNTIQETRSFYRLATDLDPHFFELYDQAAIFFMFYVEDATLAREILQKGIQFYEQRPLYPKYWFRPHALYLHLAYLEAFMAQDWAQAKQVYIRASQVPSAPSYLSHMRLWLDQEGSEKQLAIRVLKLLIETTSDELLKSQYQKKLRQYES